MPLTLYYHPLSSFCWKALIALYEVQIPFAPRQVNLSDPADKAVFQAVWPLAKFPVLTDESRNETVPESTIVVEYLAERFPSARGLVPTDPESARAVRLKDRLIDNYIHLPCQQVVAERLRPADRKDPFGAQQARDQIRRGYDLIVPMIEGSWAMGEAFTLADCAAFPALFYADYAVSLDPWPALRAYLARLKARPAIARVLAEAEPYFQYFPLKDG
ncbi:MAG TPA: glutathione S-transferase family protein [Xanthobacteraceae bacterium]|jgi:glutathione S-transferase|nr:glutathione S-transferase family protein [Xanthobacteraceae bacterium]